MTQEAAAFPWPPGDDSGAPTAFAETWRRATFQPKRFFGRLPEIEGTGAPVVYYLILGVMVAAIQLFWNTVLQAVGLREPAPWAADLGAMGPWIDVIGLLMSPIILLLLLLASAGVTHLLLMLFGGSSGGFERTIQVFSFAYSPQAFAVVPWIGPVVGFFWTIPLSIIGLREGHRTDGWRAALAVLLPLVAFLGLFVLFGMLVAFAELAP